MLIYHDPLSTVALCHDPRSFSWAQPHDLFYALEVIDFAPADLKALEEAYDSIILEMGARAR